MTLAGLPQLLLMLPALGLALGLLMLLASRAALKRMPAAAAVRAAPEEPAALPPGATVGAAAGLVRVLTGRAGGFDTVPLIAVVGMTSAALARMIPEVGVPGARLRRAGEEVARGGCRLRFGEEGIVAGFDDGLLDSDTWEQRWSDLVNALAAARQDLPFDGLVLAIPAARLVGLAALPDEGLSALGERLYRLLWSAQRQSGWRVPVHLVVTGCETLTGFAATAAAMPTRFRHRPFGWCSPFDPDTLFERRWIDDALASLLARLSAWQVRLLPRIGNVPAAAQVLLFPQAVAALGPPLATVLASALRMSAYGQPFMFRGFYLTGRGGAEAAAEAGGEVFAARLFDERIFPEHTLARPIEGAATRRTRRIRIAQVAMAALLLFGLFGLSRLPLERPAIATVQRLLDSMTGVGVALRSAGFTVEGGQDTPNDAHVEAAQTLLRALAGVTVNRLETPWAPLSYMSNASRYVVDAIRAGYEIAILRAVHDRLTECIPRLIAASAEEAPAGGAVSSWCSGRPGAMEPVARLGLMLTRSGEYWQQLQLYQSLPQAPDIDRLAALLQFVFRLPLPPGFTSSYRLYETGLSGAVAQPLAMGPIRSTMRSLLQRQAARAIDASYARSELAVSVLAIAAESSPGNDLTEHALQRLRSIDADARIVARAAASAESDWVGGGTVGARMQGLIDQLTRLTGRPNSIPDDLAPVPAELPDQVRAEAQDAAAATRAALAGARAFGSVPVLQVGGGSAALAPGMAPIVNAIQAFLAQPLLAAKVGTGTANADGVAQADAPLLWDVQQLTEVQGLAETYQSFAAQNLPAALPPVLDAMISAAAGEQLAALVDDAIGKARRQGGLRPAVGAANQAGVLRDEIGRFAEVAPLAASLRLALRQAGRVAAANRLDAILAGQAQRLLRGVDALLLNADPYQLTDRTLSFWTGTPPLAAPAFGAGSLPELVGTLPARRDYVEELSRDYAAPLLAYLQQSEVLASGQDAVLRARWSGIADTLARYHRGDPSNAMSQLEQFIAADMDRVTLADCQTLPVPAAGADDWFAQQMQGLRRAVVARCGAIVHADTVAGYADLAASFNATLAGRFPFGGADAPDADPNDVKRFFTDYGPQLADLQTRLAARRDGAGVFIGQLVAVQAALAPLLADPSPEAALAYTVAIDFRSNAGGDPGADQIIERSVRVGAVVRSSFDTERSLGWASGQPVEVRLRWASGAPTEPQPTEPQPGGPGLVVQERTAIFRATGAWALLRLIAQQRPGPGVLTQLNDRRPETLAFAVPLRRNPAAALGGDAGLTLAQAFMRLTLSATLHTPGQPDRQMAVVLPGFPAGAPPPGFAARATQVRAAGAGRRAPIQLAP